MYEPFYGLKFKPFAVVPDPRFIYWGRSHSIAYAMLEYGILNHAGFTVITGEVGSGKTTLIRHLLSKLDDDDINVGLLSNVRKGRGELLEWVLMAFGENFDSTSIVELHKRFEDYLRKQNQLGRRTVLIVDEAQNLGTDTLEELRLISNVNAHDLELLQIVLSGQPELKRMLADPQLRQFTQRVSSDFHLELLDHNEVIRYIAHRLVVAGATRPLFSQDACELICDATQGTPRLINILCDSALMYAYATEAPHVTEKLVNVVLEDKRKHGLFPMTRVAEKAFPASSGVYLAD